MYSAILDPINVITMTRMGGGQCRKFEGNFAEASAKGASRSCGRGSGGLFFFFFFFFLNLAEAKGARVTLCVISLFVSPQTTWRHASLIKVYLGL